jgi:signal transduction histidine kinase/CheY-like chemotaxis protein
MKPPLAHLSVIAFVAAPSPPLGSVQLVNAVAALTLLLLGIAVAVTLSFTRTAKQDVDYVRSRIEDMARMPDAGAAPPEGAGPRGSLVQKIPIRSLDQVGALTAAFNGLVARFAAAEARYVADLSEASLLDKERTQFLAGLSHELRTPLNAILGWTHILLEKPVPPQTVGQGLAVIDRNARIQAKLIADLLDMSRIISGKMRLEVQRVDVQTVINAAIESVRPSIDAKGIRIQSIIEPITDTVIGDPARLQQIVWNLLSNAVKFTARGGRVQVVLASINSHVQLSVEDSGQGISAEFLPHVFQRFRQANSSAARTHGGLGLGLSIVRQLVELHGGNIRVESDGEGKGAKFTVQLPLSAVAQGPLDPQENHPRSSALEPLPSDSPDFSGVRLLVVDDDQDSRDLLVRLLEECRASVVVATSADDALHNLAASRFDAIVSDISMPEKDGYAFIRETRQRGCDTPAVALTAFARSEDRTRALRAGFQTHISKPVEPSELFATIQSVIRGDTRPVQIGSPTTGH